MRRIGGVVETDSLEYLTAPGEGIAAHVTTTLHSGRYNEADIGL